MKARFAAAVAAFFISSSAQAVLVELTELPSSLQTCFSYGGNCWGSSFISAPIPGSPTYLVSTYDLPNMSSFQYMEGNVEKWLLRYNVLPSVSQAGGPLWLSANNAYDLTTNSHSFTLYTDRLTPTPSSYDYFMWGGPAIGLTLDSTGLLSGGGNGQAGLDWSNQPYSTGSLSVLNGAAICVAEGCNVSAQLNLIDLQYLGSGNIATLNFNTSDNRSLLFNQTSFDPYCNNMTGCSSQQQFIVQSVPVLPAFWLLVSGLAGLGGLARKRKSFLAS